MEIHLNFTVNKFLLPQFLWCDNF